MISLKRIRARLSFIEKYQFRLVLIIAVSWTVIDLAFWYVELSHRLMVDTSEAMFIAAVLLRAIVVFVMSSVVGYFLVFKLRGVFRNFPLIINLLIKTVIMMTASVVMNFLLHFTYSVFILRRSVFDGFSYFFGSTMSVSWLLQHSVGWIILFLLTQMIIEINEKYSPGVFWDILIGKYITPKVQKRIVMFIDLQDSTPIAEKLGSTDNFKFIRDFIYYVSVGLMEHDGRIYQYVGDEIVVSWLYSERNVHKCLDALVLSSKLLQRHSSYFLLRYGVAPEFKAGIHAGEVTVGEIGIVKKDIAMSGDTMNTAARIRASCNELNHKYIVSRDFLANVEISWQTEELGFVDLKGKNEGVELFALNV